MDQAIKKKWIRALRSGKYEQAQSALKRGDQFCCLGVLCDILDPKGWGVRFDCLDSYTPAEIERRAKLRRVSAKRLAKLNDDGKSFKEIAAEIDRSL